jgi:CRP-like cAMP-binding protein
MIFFIEKLNTLSPLSDESKAALTQIIQKITFAKNELILKEGKVSDYFYFLNKGTIRIFYRKHDKEVTEWLALDNEFFLSIASFYQRTPSHLAIQTLEETTLFMLPHDEFMLLCAQHHEIETLHRKMLTFCLLLSQNRIESIQFEPAQQRYEKLIRLRPDIIQKVHLTYIASFLGITLETLSRIRGK